MSGDRLTFTRHMAHFAEMPLGLVGDDWAPGGSEFEKARAGTARSMTRLCRTKVTPDQVCDWEVRSWLRHKRYGDPTMAGLHAAIREQERAVLTLPRPAKPDLFNRGGPHA